MGAAWYRTRSELRRRWRATLLLVLLVGLIGGIVLTTVASTRRSSTAYERFREETLAGDLDIAPSDPSEEDFEAIRDLPQVEAMTRLAFPFIVPKGEGLYPFLDFLAMSEVDNEFGRTMNLPRMLAGRLPPPGSVHDMVVSENYAAEADLAVGDEVTFESYAPDQFESLFTTGDAGPPAGPEVTLTVAGILRVPDFLSESVGSFSPRVFMNQAFLEEYGDEMAVYPGGAAVRLRNGAADVPAVIDAVRALFPDDAELELQPASDLSDRIEESLDVLVLGLLLCALLAVLAGVVVLGQALARHLSRDGADERNLTSLGMRRRERVASLVAAAVPVAVGGTLLAGVLAVVASPLMPVGLARKAEPDRGRVGGRARARRGDGRDPADGRGAGRARSVDRHGGPSGRRGGRVEADRSQPNVGRAAGGRTGGAGATRSDRGRDGVGPWRPRSDRDTRAVDPRRHRVRHRRPRRGRGVRGQHGIPDRLTTTVRLPLARPGRGFQGGLLEENGDELLDDPDVAALASLTTSLAHLGQSDVNIHAFVTLKGKADPTLLDGDLPSGPHEVALGTATIARCRRRHRRHGRDGRAGDGGAHHRRPDGLPRRRRPQRHRPGRRTHSGRA